MATVDKHPIATIRKKRPDIAAKRIENKQKLVKEVLSMIYENMHEYKNLCLDLMEESLQRRSQKQLKEWL